MKYVVTKTYSFDPETKAYEFDVYEKAKAFLLWWWEDDYNTELVQSMRGIDEALSYHDTENAALFWNGNDGDFMEYNLMEIESELPAEFEKTDWRRYL